jgi:hypothetical protein
MSIFQSGSFSEAKLELVRINLALAGEKRGEGSASAPFLFKNGACRHFVALGCGANLLTSPILQETRRRNVNSRKFSPPKRPLGLSLLLCAPLLLLGGLRGAIFLRT